MVSYGARYYAAWLCRFVSVDPLQFKYPHYTPYQYAGNKPISFIDLDGLEPYIPPQVKKFADYTENKINDAYDELKDISETVMEISKGIAKGSFNLLLNMTMAGQADNTVISKDALYNQNAFESTLGFDPTKSYKQMIETFNSGTLEEKAQLSTELLGSAILIFEGVKQSKGVVTKYTWASQEFSQAALEARKAILEGKTLYRLGTKGVSATGTEAQFWSLENPTNNIIAYAKKYNIPFEKIENYNFIETANLKEGASFITKKVGAAPKMIKGGGKGIEAVIEKGGTINNKIYPIKY
jgi:hypothetical protein